MARKGLNHVPMFGIGCAAAMLAASCQTLEQMAPPVSPALAAWAGRGIEDTRLESGRWVYLTDCAACHGVEPIRRYSADRWRRILPRMAIEAKLNDTEQAAVEAYVLTARAFLAQDDGAS